MFLRMSNWHQIRWIVKWWIVFWWIVNCQSLENVLKLRVVTVFPSKRNFVPKFSLCWSLKWYWWKGDDIREFQRTLTIGIRLWFNCLTTRFMIFVGSLTMLKSDGHYAYSVWILHGPVYIGFNFPGFLNDIMPFLGRTFNITLPTNLKF